MCLRLGHQSGKPFKHSRVSQIHEQVLYRVVVRLATSESRLGRLGVMRLLVAQAGEGSTDEAADEGGDKAHPTADVWQRGRAR